MRPRALAVVGLLVATMLVSCGRTPTLRTSAHECDPVRGQSGGTTEHQVESDGRDRTYLLHLPPDYDGASRVPVMFMFHGFGGDPATLLATTRMTDVADDNTFAIVAPQGAGFVPSWKFRPSGGEPGADVTFTHDLLRDVEQTVCVDPSRTYAVGFSNGSALTMALACQTSRAFSAFAAVSAPYYGPECREAPRRSILYFHGTRDIVVPFDGSDRTVIGALPPVSSTLQSWAQHDACARPAAKERVTPHVVRYRWLGCAHGSSVASYIVLGGGHRWPGGVDGSSTGDQDRTQGVTTQEIDASELIWAFLRVHHR